MGGQDCAMLGFGGSGFFELQGSIGLMPLLSFPSLSLDFGVKGFRVRGSGATRRCS